MRHFISGAALLLLLFTGCRKEVEGPAEEPGRYASFQASIGCDTRSQATLAVENFHKAMCFAFGPDGNILVYGSGAGALQGKPVVCYTEDRDFSWDLPLGQAMDLWCIVNYGSLDLSGCLTDTSLSKNDLSQLTFTSTSPGSLKALETSGQGLPMAGREEGVTLSGADDALRIRVKYLFAKYQIRFSSADLLSDGWEILAQDISVQNASTSVYWFREGETPPGCTWCSYDAATSAELSAVNLCRQDSQVTLYMLENCQGDKGPAGSWRTVRQDIGESALAHCTYIYVQAVVQKEGEGRKTREYKIYLGQRADMKSNFDVCRNTARTIGLNLQHPSDAFEFTGSHALTARPGESLRLPYETTLDESEISLSGIPIWTNAWSAANAAGITDYPFSGRFTITIPANAAAGTVYQLSGGGSTVSDAVSVTVRSPLELSAQWVQAATYIGYDCRFTVDGLESGESVASVTADSGVYVASLNGADVTFAPGKTAQTVVITTSEGRTLEVPLTARMPSLQGPSKLLLQLDGTAVDWTVRYVYGSTPLSGFNESFYSRYLQPSSVTLTPVSSVYANLFRAAYCGALAYTASTWDITGGCPYSTTLATVQVKPVNYALIDPLSISLQVKPVYTGAVASYGYLDNYSLIPARGSISTSYLSSQGLTYGPQTINVTLDGSALGVSTDRITTLESSNITLSDIRRTGPYAFTCTGAAESGSGAASIFFVVTHPESGTSCRVLAGSVRVRLHLAVGGVRTSLSWSGSQASFSGAALFASNYQGSESARYQDWPLSAVRLKNNFQSGQSHAKCITYAGNSGILEQDGGTVWARVEVAEGQYGTGVTLYTVRYRDPGGYTGRINAHYQSYTPYQKLYTYQENGSLGSSATRLVFGDIQVHAYGNLYPSSKGWLTPGNDCETLTF